MGYYSSTSRSMHEYDNSVEMMFVTGMANAR
jgi:hypothetical protein